MKDSEKAEILGQSVYLDRSDTDALTLRILPENAVIATRVRRDGRYFWRSPHKNIQALLNEWQSGSTGETLANILSKAIT